MENVNQMLFEFDPDDGETETWIEQALASFLACCIKTLNFTMVNKLTMHDAPTVVTESASFKTRSSVSSITYKASRYHEKLIQAKLLKHDLKAAK